MKKSISLNPDESKVVEFTYTPSEAKTYQVSVDGLIGSFVAIEAAPPSGEILELKWKRYSDTDVWHSASDPMPEYTDIIHRFKVRNTGNATTLFRIGHYVTGYGEGWYYSDPVDINPGEEGYIEWVLWAGEAGTYTTTWYLFGDDIEVDSMTITTMVS